MSEQKIRISVCVKDPLKASSVCEKIGRMRGAGLLKAVWDQPEIAWVADVIVADSHDVAHMLALKDMPFCPAILLLEPKEGAAENVVKALGRVPFASLSLQASDQQMEDLFASAASNTRMLFESWHGKDRKGMASVEGQDLLQGPSLSIESVVYLLKNWQAEGGAHRTLGEMFQRWSGSSRVLIVAASKDKPEDFRVLYSHEDKEHSLKEWTWAGSEPWMLYMEKQGGVIEKNVAGVEMFRWMEALKVQYAVPLRHQEKFLGVLAFSERSGRVPFAEKDWRILGDVAMKISQALYLWREAKSAPAPLKASPDKGAEMPAAAPAGKEGLRKQQLEIIGRMAMRSSHELKNCLVSIRTFTQLFPEKYADEQFRKDFYEVVSKEVERLNGLVEKLLFFAQPVQLKFSQEKITDLISEALTLFAPADLQNIQMHKVFGHKHPTIWLDRQQMLAVFYHILQNAIQSMGNGGKLVIVTEDHPHPDYAEGVLAVRILDNGRGIALKDKEETFEPFFSTKARGIGLGLTIARRIIEEHGGTIRLESGKDKGTEVILCLPRKIPRWNTQSAANPAAEVNS